MSALMNFPKDSGVMGRGSMRFDGKLISHVRRLESHDEGIA
jgi:hypothetical protein